METDAFRRCVWIDFIVIIIIIIIISYKKSGKQVISYSPSLVKRRNLMHLWSTNKNVIGAHVGLPKINTARAA